MNDYFPSDLHVTLSGVELIGGVISDPAFRGFGMKILYGPEYEFNLTFSFSSEEKFFFRKAYASIHFLK